MDPTCSERLDLAAGEKLGHVLRVEDGDVVDILREGVEEVEEEAADIALLLAQLGELLAVRVVAEVVVELKKLEKEDGYERSEKMVVLLQLVVVTHQVGGVQNVVRLVDVVVCPDSGVVGNRDSVLQ